MGGRPIAYGRNAFFSKTADPYSTLVLSPLMMEVFRLQVIPPAYPVGQEREVTVYKQEKLLMLECGNNKFCETS
jgi:hypothetical protein